MDVVGKMDFTGVENFLDNFCEAQGTRKGIARLDLLRSGSRPHLRGGN